MSIKRHPALQPFSRDHLIGLFHAQRLIKLEHKSGAELLGEVMTGFAEAWQREIKVHFNDEDRVLGPMHLRSASLERLHDEHIELTDLIVHAIKEPYSVELASRVGAMLDAHIRWEEHELFPEVESTLNEAELETLSAVTAEIEKSRHRKLV